LGTDSTHWRTGQAVEDVVGQVRCGLGHSARVARGADATAFAGEGDQIVVPAVVAADARKAVGKDAAFEVFVERLLRVRGRGVMVALAVEFIYTYSKQKHRLLLSCCFNWYLFCGTISASCLARPQLRCST